MKSICLTMIVKDEATIIERCLAHVKPLISHWVIVDTGSSDETPAIIERTMNGIPGELHHRKWVDFAHNRTEAFELARGKADYMLVVDADDELLVPASFAMPTLTEPMLSVRVEYGNLVYYRAQLFRSDLPWRYEGVLHEYATCGQTILATKLEGPVLRVHRDGARAKDPERYAKDAEVLEAALKKDPSNARYAFYLAQSYRDARDDVNAESWYAKRAEMGGFAEEVYVSLYERGRALERLGRGKEEVWGAYLSAYAARPSRDEAVCALARFARVKGDYALARMFAAAALETPPSGDVLFVDTTVAKWRALDEFSIASYYTKHYEESAAACRALLDENRAPASEHARIRKNLDFAVSALKKK